MSIANATLDRLDNLFWSDFVSTIDRRLRSLLFTMQFEPLEEVTPAMVDQSEIVWIAKLNTLHPHGYNLDAGRQKKEPSKLSRERRRKPHLGKSLSLKHRAAISASLRGKTYTGHWFDVTDPNGEILQIQNLRAFCTRQSLNYNSIRCALRRTGKWKGWTFQKILALSVGT